MREKQDLLALSSGWDEGEYNSESLTEILNEEIGKMTSGQIVVSSLVILGWDFPRRSQQHLEKFVSLLLDSSNTSILEFPLFYRTDSIKPESGKHHDPIFTWYDINKDKQLSKNFLETVYQRFFKLISEYEFFKIGEDKSDKKVILSVKKGMVIYDRASERSIHGLSLIVKANKNAYDTNSPYIIS